MNDFLRNDFCRAVVRGNSYLYDNLLIMIGVDYTIIAMLF